MPAKRLDWRRETWGGETWHLARLPGLQYACVPQGDGSVTLLCTVGGETERSNFATLAEAQAAANRGAFLP